MAGPALTGPSAARPGTGAGLAEPAGLAVVAIYAIYKVTTFAIEKYGGRKAELEEFRAWKQTRAADPVATEYDTASEAAPENIAVIGAQDLRRAARHPQADRRGGLGVPARADPGSADAWQRGWRSHHLGSVVCPRQQQQKSVGPGCRQPH
jgi:hypothetical protein